MSSRTASSGQQGIRPGSHYAPVPTRSDSNIIQLVERVNAYSSRSHSLGARNESASIYRASMQAGSNTSPDLFVSVVAGSHGGEKTPFSFAASGASFKRGEFVQSLIDVGAAVFAFLFIALVGFSITTAILILLFVVSFH